MLRDIAFSIINVVRKWSVGMVGGGVADSNAGLTEIFFACLTVALELEMMYWAFPFDLCSFALEGVNGHRLVKLGNF